MTSTITKQEKIEKLTPLGVQVKPKLVLGLPSIGNFDKPIT